MTLRQLSKDAVVAALSTVEGACFAECRWLAENDGRSTFPTAESPAFLIRENLELKHAIARSRGRQITGDAELLLALADLGPEKVCGISFDTGTRFFALYLQVADLRPVGCVLVTDDVGLGPTGRQSQD